MPEQEGRPDSEAVTAQRPEEAPCLDLRTIKPWAAALLIVTLIAYGLGLSTHWRIGMDQAFYASIARSVASGQGYTFSGRTQPSVPPITPLYLAGAWKLGHWLQPGISFLETAIYFNAFMLVAGLAGLVTAFFLIREIIFGAPVHSVRRIDLRPNALVVITSLLVVLSGRYYRLSMETMSDVPFAVVTWAALLFLLRSRRAAGSLSGSPQSAGRANLALAAFFLALAPLVRVASLVLIANVAGMFIHQAFTARARRRAALRGLAAVAPALALLTLMLLSVWLGKEEGAFSYLSEKRTLTSCLAAWPANLAEVPARLFGVFFGVGSRIAPGIIMLPVVALGAFGWWRRGQKLVVSYVTSYLVMTTAVEVPQTRYFVPMMPFVFLFTIEGVLMTANLVVDGMTRIQAGTVLTAARSAAVATAVGLLAVTLATNLRAIGRVLAPRFADDFYRTYQKGEYYDYLALARDLASKPPSGAVMAREHRVIHALSQAPVCRPFSGYESGKADIYETSEYIQRNTVAEIVVDPRHGPSAAAFLDYIEQSAPAWQVSRSHGTLTLYSRSELGD